MSTDGIDERPPFETWTQPTRNIGVASSETPAGPPLDGEWISLRAVLPLHHRALYEVAMADQLSFRWRHRGSVPNFEAFVQGLYTGVLCQFVVTYPQSDEAIGLVVGYAPDLRNGHAFIAIVMTPDLVGSGAGMEAVALFVNYLFATWPLRKLYFEATEFNYGRYASGEGWLFEKEGCMRGHWFYGGRYWDEYLLAWYRDSAALNLPRLTPALRSRGFAENDA